MTHDEYLGIIRAMIQQEDTLRDQRLGWLFALNGLLFAALGFSWADSHSTPLVAILAFVGVAVSLTTKAALTTNDHAVKKLKKAARSKMTDADPPVWGIESAYFEHPCRSHLRLVPHLYPWKLLPWLLVIAWAAIFLARLFR